MRECSCDLKFYGTNLKCIPFLQDSRMNLKERDKELLIQKIVFDPQYFLFYLFFFLFLRNRLALFACYSLRIRIFLRVRIAVFRLFGQI